MNKPEHLLTCLAEEGTEIAHHVCKALRFGIDDRDPTIEDAPTERESIRSEINDLLGVIELLQEHRILPDNSCLYSRELINAKKAKVRKFMQYAVRKGSMKIEGVTIS